MQTETKRKVIIYRQVDVRLHQDWAVEMTDEEAEGLAEAMRQGSAADEYLRSSGLYLRGELVFSGTGEENLASADVFAYDKDGVL